MNKIIKAFIIFLLLQLGYSANAQVTDTIHVRANWNMVSLPLKVQDAYYLTIFPGAISPPFTYDPLHEGNTLENGISYFIKFASDTTYLITGEPIHSIILNLPWAGWHMIGSISYPVPVNNIQIDPTETMRSDFFGYNPACGYEKADTIKPGSGYWIKVDRACIITLTSMGYPCPGIPTVEYEGKTYSTVQIGNQCWLKENLNVGTMIQGVDTAKNNAVIEKYCYNDSIENCDKYGGLYKWTEAMAYSMAESAQGICLDGFHIPTLGEFQILNQAVGGDGNVLKAIDQGDGDGIGTNTSGFSALLAGYRRDDGDFFYTRGYFGFLWSSTRGNYINGYFLQLFYDESSITLDDQFGNYGFSVRCLKD